MNKCQINWNSKIDPKFTALAAVSNGPHSLWIESNHPQSAPLEKLTFPIYSLTKTFIAALLLKLVEKNKLQLQQKLKQTIDLKIPAWINELTLEDLLTHRSGLGDYGYTKEYQAELARHPETPPAESWPIDLVAQQGPLFPAGTSFNYSNVGYLFLKKIIEQSFELSFAEIVKQEICLPLELSSTKILNDINDLKKVDLPGFGGLASRPEEDVRSYYHPAWVAHGLIASNIADLSRFMLSYVEGHFNKNFSAQIKSPYPLNFPSDLVKPHYGLGLMGDPQSQWGSLLGHQGEGPGYSVCCYVLSTYLKNPVVVTAVVGSSKPQGAFDLSVEIFNQLKDA